MTPSAIAATPIRSAEKLDRALCAAVARGVVLGLAEQPVAAQPDVVEEQLAGARAVNAHLAERL